MGGGLMARLIGWFWVAFPWLVFAGLMYLFIGCTDRHPTEPEFCTDNGYVKICDGDTVKVRLGTANNALGARGMK